MNYATHYDRLMSRARDRILAGYRERHHVLPRCMGGGDEPDNLVDLTAEEHYVAHQLLVKMFPGVRGLVFAIVRMAKQCAGNKVYGWLRRRHALAASEFMKGRQHSKGKKRGPMSAERKAKISAANSGRKRTQETKDKLSTAHLGKKLSPEHAANVRRALQSTAARTKMSSAHRGKKFDESHKANLRWSLMAYHYLRKHPFPGKRFEG